MKWLCASLDAGTVTLPHHIISAAGAHENLINHEDINWRAERKGKYKVNSLQCGDFVSCFHTIRWICRYKSYFPFIIKLSIISLRSSILFNRMLINDTVAEDTSLSTVMDFVKIIDAEVKRLKGLIVNKMTDEERFVCKLMRPKAGEYTRILNKTVPYESLRAGDRCVKHLYFRFRIIHVWDWSIDGWYEKDSGKFLRELTNPADLSKTFPDIRPLSLESNISLRSSYECSRLAVLLRHRSVGLE